MNSTALLSSHGASKPERERVLWVLSLSVMKVNTNTTEDYGTPLRCQASYQVCGYKDTYGKVIGPRENSKPSGEMDQQINR